MKLLAGFLSYCFLSSSFVLAVPQVNAVKTQAPNIQKAFIGDELLLFRLKTEGRFRGIRIEMDPSANLIKLFSVHLAIDDKRKIGSLQRTKSGTIDLLRSTSFILTTPMSGNAQALTMFNSCSEVLLAGANSEVSRARFNGSAVDIDNSLQGFPTITITVNAKADRTMAPVFSPDRPVHERDVITIALDDPALGNITCETMPQF